MTRRVSATEAKNRLGELLRVVSHEGETVVVENRREPTAVIVSFADYQELQTLREAKRRQDAVAELRQIAERQAERNKDLTEEEAQELVERAVADTMEALVSSGKIRFEE
jgi:prevent-host-death family protein